MSKHVQYPAHIFYSEEDEGFIATAPDLPGSSAFGKTQEGALKELQHAIDAWITAAKAAGNPIPEPSAAKVQPQPSGKILLRVPRSLHSQLIEGAKREGTSLNQHIVYLLTYASTCRVIDITLNTARSAAQAVTLSSNVSGLRAIGTVPMMAATQTHMASFAPGVVLTGPTFTTQERVVQPWMVRHG